MPRPNKIWFRKDTGWWMAIAGKKVKLTLATAPESRAEQEMQQRVIASKSVATASQTDNAPVQT